ncbi:MAG: TIGR02186 family protein [Cypionkella sp.]
MIRALFALMLLALPVRAQQPPNPEEIVSGVSQSGVAITTSFDGAAILIYGAAIREAPPPDNSLLQVIITVQGPDTALIIRKKEHVAGIWINQGSVKIASAPSYYAVATSGDLDQILSPEEDAKYRISIPQTITAGGVASADQADYIRALQRIKAASGSYKLAQDSVLLLRQALFRTDVTLPANLIEGIYKIRIFLTRNKTVVDMQNSQIEVRKAGLERTLYNLAMDQPLYYGILSLVLAMLAGWGASELFRRLRL